MIIFKCYFSGEHITLSYKKNNNDVNIELGITNRLKALCMMQIIHDINKLFVNKPRQSMKDLHDFSVKILDAKAMYLI